MEKKSSLDRAGEFMLSGGNTAVMFSQILPGNATNDVGRPTNVTIAGRGAKIVSWGAKNDLPFYREDLIAGNNIVPSLMTRKASIIQGQGWYAYRERYEDGDTGAMKRIVDEVPMTDDMKAFFDDFDWSKLVGELVKHELCLIEFIRNRDRSFSSARPLETKYLRAGRKDQSGNINQWFWSNAWTAGQRRQLDTTEMVLTELITDQEAAKFVLPLMDDLFNDGYYPIPAWWGGRWWIELSNAIPAFHLANLRNMSAPRWLLVVPYGYFRDYEAWEQATDEDGKKKVLADEAARKQQFVNDFNDLVTGMENTGRTLTVESITDEFTKQEKRIMVEPLVIDLRDEALLKLFESSNVANISAQGLHPTLANIETQGRLSSGTEIRNAYLLWLIIAAPKYRRAMKKVVNLVQKLKGWPADIQFEIRDAELTTLADNPAGVRQSEKAPT